jgi:hypothetical protein
MSAARLTRLGHAVEPPLTILVAEDEALIGLAVEDALGEAGFSVELLDAGNAAIAALDAGREFVALITDVRLGSGPSGASPREYVHAQSYKAHKQSAQGDRDRIRPDHRADRRRRHRRDAGIGTKLA